MARMGHEIERAAMIYQHQVRGAGSAITRAIDAFVRAAKDDHQGDDDGMAGVPVPVG
jgi:hypothetical protein